MRAPLVSLVLVLPVDTSTDFSQSKFPPGLLGEDIHGEEYEARSRAPTEHDLTDINLGRDRKKVAFIV